MNKIHLENKKNIIFTLCGLTMGVIITLGSIKFLPLAIKLMPDNEKNQQAMIDAEDESKKQELAEFYNKISTAQDNQDWKSMYQLVPQSIRDNVTEDQFILSQKNTNPQNIFSKKTIVSKIEVNGDRGVVFRTIMTCFKEDCQGENKKEDNGKREYEYVEGKWQMPDPKPSERSLKAVNYLYSDMTESDQKESVKNYSYGSGNVLYALRNKAIELDNNLEDLIRIETMIEKAKAEQSRPIINYETPSVTQKTPTVIQQQTYPKNCISNQVGNSTYTNCY